MSSDLRGTRVLVSGASRGLGRAIVLAVAAEGADVHLVGRDGERLRAVCEEALALGAGSGEVHAVDLADPDGATRLHEELPALDVLFANAGVGEWGPVSEDSVNSLRRQLDTNVVGTFALCSAFGQSMLQHGGGKIITTASDLAFRGGSGWAAYAASKAAIVAMSKSLAWEWAPHVTVNVLAPGAFETDLNASLLAHDDVRDHLLHEIPLGRLGQPQDLAGIAVLLASRASDYMTGSVITVSGGIGRF